MHDVPIDAQRADSRSMLAFYRALIAWRRKEPPLKVGRWEPLKTESTLLAAWRIDGAVHPGDQA
jgi:hypothetical protein